MLYMEDDFFSNFFLLCSPATDQEALKSFTDRVSRHQYASESVVDESLGLEVPQNNNDLTLVPLIRSLMAFPQTDLSSYSYEDNSGLAEAEQVQLKFVECRDEASSLVKRVGNVLRTVEEFDQANEGVLKKVEELKGLEWMSGWKLKIVNAVITRLSVSENSRNTLSSKINESDDLDSMLSALLDIQQVHYSAQGFHRLMKNLLDWFDKDNNFHDVTYSTTTALNQTFPVKSFREAENLLRTGIENLSNLIVMKLRSFRRPQPPIDMKSSREMLCRSVGISESIVPAIEIIRQYPSTFKHLVEQVSLARTLYWKHEFECLSAHHTLEEIQGHMAGLHFCVDTSSLNHSEGLLEYISLVYDAISSELQFASLLFLEDTEATLWCGVKESKKENELDEERQALVDTMPIKLVKKAKTRVAFVDEVFSEATLVLMEKMNGWIKEFQEDPVAIAEIYCIVASFTLSIFVFLEKSSVRELLDQFVDCLNLHDQLGDRCELKMSIQYVKLLEMISNSLLTSWDNKFKILKRQLNETLTTSFIDVPLCLHDYVSLTSLYDVNVFIQVFRLMIGQMLDVRKTVELLSSLAPQKPGPLDAKTEEATKILWKLLHYVHEPLLQVLTSSSHRFLDEGRRQVYLINCFILIQEVLAPFTDRIKEVSWINWKLEMDKKIPHLRKYVLESVLKKLGISLRLSMLKQWNELSGEQKKTERLSEIPCLYPLSLSLFLHETYNRLLLMESIPLEPLDSLSSLVLVKKERKIILCHVLKVYEELLSEAASIKEYCIIPSFQCLLDDIKLSGEGLTRIVNETTV